MSDNPFVHLHVHTEFSLLDGLSDINQLIERAQKTLNMPALAITDHGTMFGVMDFYRAAKKAGIKPIIGMEGYLAPRTMRDKDSKLDSKPYHLLMLAQDETGYQNLLRIASAAQLEGYYYRPRIDREFLQAHSDGLVVTTGCLAAEVPSLILKEQYEAARKRIHEYVDIFGRDRFYLELQQHEIDELKPVNEWLIDIAEKDRLNLVATADVHYVSASDYEAHDTLLCIQSSAVKTDTNRLRMSDNSYYLIEQDLMWQWFGHIQGGAALKNSITISEMCDISLDKKGYHLPIFTVPDGFTSASYLRHLAEIGLRWRYGDRADTDPKLRERLDYELGVIEKMGFTTYFLIVWDLCEFARAVDIWWNVRGSGAGCVVAYCIGITNIDPIQNNLLFERFLNPGRVSMPDIDMDFPDDRRGELIQYAVGKYGEDKVAAIITFGTLGAKQAIRDVGRALNLDLTRVNEVTKLIPTEPKPKKVSEYVSDNPELLKLRDSDADIRVMLETAEKLQGLARHASTHAAGVIISDKPLEAYVPLHRPTKESKSTRDNDADGESGSGSISLDRVTQFPMETCESIGLLKVDFLGLSTLTIMRRACDLIRKHHGETYSMDNIPYRPTGDERLDEMLRQTFVMIGYGHTVGVFQVESSGMQQMLREMRPSKFEHIIAAISLYRPGPMDYIPEFNARMHGTKEIHYHHPRMETILAETYGIITYQEQIMQIASDMFGYSLGDADLMRRAVSKKKKDDLHKHKAIFLENGPKVDPTITPEVAENIFNDIEFFANYGFNKCLVGSTEVVDADTGAIVTIDSLIRGEKQIGSTLALDTQSQKLKRAAVAQITPNGVKPVYRLTTQLGRQIEATDNHPFLTFGGWRNLGELTIGDQIALPRVLPIEGKHEWDDHRLIVLGHLLAEGNLRHTTGVYYYTTDQEQLNDYVNHLNQHENTEAVTAIHKSAFSVYSRRRDRRLTCGVVEWIKSLGLWGKDSHTKFIPDEVFTLNNRSIGLMISRMWEGDGHINTTSRNVYYATASERMARQLQHLLLRFGIISKLRRVTFPYKEGRIGYQLFVTGNDNLAAFDRSIACHFVSQTRRDRVRSLILEKPDTSGIKDVIPLEIKQLVRAAQARSAYDWRSIHQQTGIAIREFSPTSSATKSGFSRETIARLATFFDDDQLRAHAHSDVYWDKIVSIEYTGEQPTYDLTIPEHHNFVANDIIVHNSHAADYAVITVQTAFLKAHYPAEYMAALLTVYFDAPDKMAILLDECRRLQIPLLRPDINYSALDFDIQYDGQDHPAIRFGMAAVKNAGVGALQLIIHEREHGGLFTNLQEFCERLDLRTVGKRTLESLIKVGAFDDMGSRLALLAALDRMISYSTEFHRAREVGQASLFGDSPVESTGDELLKNLPQSEPTDLRTMLDWEKELLGIYVSEHPIDRLWARLSSGGDFDTTQDIKSWDDSRNNVGVRVIGLVAGLRKMPTKAKEMMCIVTVEDRFGSIEAVLFPKNWAKYQDMLEENKVFLFMGKADRTRGNWQIILDRVEQEFDDVGSADAPIEVTQDTPAWMNTAEAQAPAPRRMAYPSTNGDTNSASNGNGYHAEIVVPESPATAPWEPPADAPEWAVDNVNWDDDDDQPPPRTLIIQMQRSESEVRRWKRLLGYLTEFPGRDHVQLILMNDGEEVDTIEFPELHVNCCDELTAKLGKVGGVTYKIVES